MALTLANASRSDMADALNTRITSGSTIEIRTGTRPANPDATATGTVLATVALKNPAFTEAGGVLTIADPDPVTASGAGTASWFRLLDGSDGAVLDGSVSDSGGTGDLKLATTSITTGLSVDITGGTITMPVGSAS
jgi:hypothetical protein